MQIGYFGLGKMGKNMVLRLLEANVEVHAWNRSPEPLAEVVAAGAQPMADFADLSTQLSAPRTIWLMLPQGAVTDEILEQILPYLEAEDVVIDGANAFYKDSERRAQMLNEKGIHFMDVGVSGGPGGARNGATLMIGGDSADFVKLESLFRIIAAPDAYALLGSVGSGHFAKMVHNGIEYGMMQAIAEGAAILEKSGRFDNLSQVFDLYNHRSVIESRLVGWISEALSENPDLADISSTINHTGEGAWTVDTAKVLGVEAPVIEMSLEVRKQSSSVAPNFRNRVVSALRHAFGGHDVKG